MVTQGRVRIIGGVIIVSALIAGFFLAARSDLFRLQRIEVHSEGSQFPELVRKLQLDKLNEVLNKLRGRSIWLVSTEEVYASVLKMPWVEQVEIRKQWPSGLSVSVRPKNVIAFMTSAKGELVPVGVWGEFLPALEGSALPDVPLLQGSGFRNDQMIRRQAIELILALPHDGRLSAKTLQSISYDERKGFSLTVANVSGSILFGSGEVSQKIFRVNRVLEYLSSQTLESRVIDATYDKKVLVRLRKGP